MKTGKLSEFSYHAFTAFFLIALSKLFNKIASKLSDFAETHILKLTEL